METGTPHHPLVAATEAAAVTARLPDHRAPRSHHLLVAERTSAPPIPRHDLAQCAATGPAGNEFSHLLGTHPRALSLTFFGSILRTQVSANLCML